MFQFNNLYDEPDTFDEAESDEILDVKITSNGYLQFQWTYDDEPLTALSVDYAKDLIARMQKLIDEIETWPSQNQVF